MSRPQLYAPDPRFADDDGRPDPALAEALAALAAGRGRLTDVAQALVPARLLLPVVAVLDDAGVAAPEGPVPSARPDKRSHLAAVTLRLPDGRRAALAFTGLASLAAWRPDARPVPVTAVAAARQAVGDEVDALLLDPAGPVALPLTGPALVDLADGLAWRPPATDPRVATAVRQAIGDLPGLAAATIEPGVDADLLVTLHLLPDVAADTRAATAVASAAGRRLAADPWLVSRLERGVDLAVTG